MDKAIEATKMRGEGFFPQRGEGGRIAHRPPILGEQAMWRVRDGSRLDSQWALRRLWCTLFPSEWLKLPLAASIVTISMLLFASASYCQPPSHPGVVVVIADYLTLSDIESNKTLLDDFNSGQHALMSPGLAVGKAPELNVYASIGAGDTIYDGEVLQGLLAKTLKANGIYVARLRDGDRDEAGVYRRLNALAPTIDERIGDHGNEVPSEPSANTFYREDLSKDLARLASPNSVIFCHDGDFLRIEQAKTQGKLSQLAYRLDRSNAIEKLAQVLRQLSASEIALTIYVVVPTSTLNIHGKWDSLTPFLHIVGRNEAGGILTSDTTQTPGLIASRDIAPSILSDVGVPIPITMTGAAINLVPETAGSSIHSLDRLDRQTYLNQEAQDPVFWTLGVGGALIVLISIGLYIGRKIGPRSRSLKVTQYGLRVLAAWPLALLLAPIFDPHSLHVYLASIAAITAIIALLPTPGLIWLLTGMVLLIDGATGTRLVSQSVLSSYALAGIRFYGIGNEYMGILIGSVMLAAGIIAKRGQSSIFSVLLFAVATFVLSFPEFGAKAGGAITATAAFTFTALRLKRMRIRPIHVLLALVSGFVLIFIWAGAGHLLGTRHTHIDSAVGALGNGRFGYIVGVALRKIGLAMRVLVHPGTLWGLVGFVLVGLIARVYLRSILSAYFAENPDFAAVFQAGLGACVVAILFNDAGIVAAILLLSTLLLSLLHGLFEKPCAFSPSTLAMSELA
jgi:hypothetical protein